MAQAKKPSKRRPTLSVMFSGVTARRQPSPKGRSGPFSIREAVSAMFAEMERRNNPEWKKHRPAGYVANRPIRSYFHE